MMARDGASAIKERISAALERLLDLPLWSVGRAGIVWFLFGDRRTVLTARGGSKEVGEFALHLGCPWQLIGPAGELLASDDSEPDVLARLASPPLLCSTARSCEGGAFELGFAGGERLHVEPDDPTSEEYWRLFCPYSDQPHLVVGPAGIDPEG